MFSCDSWFHRALKDKTRKKSCRSPTSTAMVAFSSGNSLAGLFWNPPPISPTFVGVASGFGLAQTVSTSNLSTFSFNPFFETVLFSVPQSGNLTRISGSIVYSETTAAVPFGLFMGIYREVPSQPGTVNLIALISTYVPNAVAAAGTRIDLNSGALKVALSQGDNLTFAVFINASPSTIPFLLVNPNIRGGIALSFNHAGDDFL